MNSNYQELSKIEKDMCNRYKKLKEECGIDADFVKKGISFCYKNPSGGILLTGINPSIGSEDCYYQYQETTGNYWKRKKEQVTGTDQFLLNHTAYLDLFPYFESEQKKFISVLKPYPEFQAKVLEITLENIEEHIKPHLIIAANKESGFYWGYGKHTWFGYDLIKVRDDEKPLFLLGKEIQLFRINPENGFRKESDRIGQNKYAVSNIRGSYFIQYAMYNERHVRYKETRWLTPQLVKDIFVWAENQPINNPNIK